MSTTVLNGVWFAQPAIAQRVGRESNIQLSENQFDPSTMLIDVASIGQQSLERFEKLRAVKANNQVIFPANYFRPADHFGDQFLSNAIYTSLLDHHISKLRSGDIKSFHDSVLGEIQNQFFWDSSPAYFFSDAYSWDSGELRDKIEEFQIDRPSERVRDYVSLRRIKVTRQISKGNRTPFNSRDDLSQAYNPTQAAASQSSAQTARLYRKLSQLPKEIPDNNLAKEFLDFVNALGVVLNCGANPVTQAAYQQFMIDWNSAPQPVQGATWVQALLWKWLFISFPANRSKYFAVANEPDIDKHKKTVARSRRLKGLNDLISDYIERAQS